MVAINEWRRRIAVDPKVHSGDPCIAGTRIPVSVIVGSIADGDTAEQLIKSYPQLTCKDIRAALHFAAAAVSRFDVVPMARF